MITYTKSSGRSKRESKAKPHVLGGLRFAQFGPPPPAPTDVPADHDHPTAAPANPHPTGEAGGPRVDAGQAA